MTIIIPTLILLIPGIVCLLAAVGAWAVANAENIPGGGREGN